MITITYRPCSTYAPTLLEYGPENGSTKTVGSVFVSELQRGRTPAEAMSTIAEKMRGGPLLTQKLMISIPRNFEVEIGIRGDELKKEDLVKIKNQFLRWIQGLEEAFE